MDLSESRRYLRHHPGTSRPERSQQALGISEITVKARRGQLMRKMRVDSLAELVSVAAALDVPLVVHA
jgi:hypothetical protein